MIFHLDFNGDLKDRVCSCSPNDTIGSLVNDRFGHANSAFLVNTDFKPLIYDYRDDFDLSKDSVFSISLWFNSIEANDCRTDVLFSQGIIQQDGVFDVENAILFPCMNSTITAGRHDYIDSYGEAFDYKDSSAVFDDFSMNKWEHLVITFDSEKWVMYLNGEKADSSLEQHTWDWPLTIFDKNNDITIGASYDSLILDDIYYFKRVLTEDDIKDLINASMVTSISNNTNQLNNTEILEIRFFEFSGKHVLTIKKPNTSELENIKNKYSGIMKIKYTTHVKTEKIINFW